MTIPTRIVTSHFDYSPGVPVADQPFSFRRFPWSHRAGSVVLADTIPAITDAAGDASTVLWTNSEGMRPSRYTVLYPNGEQSKAFIVPEGTTPISLDELFALALDYGVPDIDDLLDARDASIYGAFAATADPALGDALVGATLTNDGIERTVHDVLDEFDDQMDTHEATISDADTPGHVDLNTIQSMIDVTHASIANSSTWIWQAAPQSTDPGTNIAVMNIDDAASAAFLILNRYGAGGTDYAGLIASLRSGDAIYIQQVSDATRWQRLQVTGSPVVTTNAFQIPITHLGDGSGGEPADAASLFVSFSPSVSGSGIPPVGGEVPDNSVTSIKIVDGSIVAGDLAANSVTATKIAASTLSVQNLVRDGLNRALPAGDNDQRERWLGPSVLARVSPDAANPYSLPTLRFLYVVSGSTNGGRYLYVDEMGVAVGDVLNFAADVYAPSGTYDLRVQCYTAALVAVPSGTFIGTTTTVTGRTRLTAPQVTVPATTVIIGFYVHRTTDTVPLDIYAMWAGKGTFAAIMPLPSALDGLAVAQQSTPLQLDDPFNADLMTTASLASSWGGRLRWQNGVTLSAVSPDAANPYGLPTLRMGTTGSSAGRRYWLDELGAKIGDVLHFGFECRAASDNFRANARFFDAAGVLIGSQTAGIVRTFAGAVATLTVGNVIVPAGAAGVAVYASRSSGSVPLDIYAMWGAKGMSLQLVPTPGFSTHLKQEIVAARGTYADLDARLDAMGSSIFPATQDRFGRFYLKDWQGAISKVIRGTAGDVLYPTEQAVIAFDGDSWSDNNLIVGPLTAWLKATYGDAGPGWCSFNSSALEPTGITTVSNSGAWTETDQLSTSRGVDIMDVTSSDAAAPAKRTRRGIFTDVVIHYMKKPGGGDFRYKIDAGGAWTTVATANATDVHATVTITGLTAVSHDLFIEILAAGTTGVTLMGADFRKSGNGVRVHKVGNGGLTAGQAIAVDATIWQAGMAALAPNLCIIILGTNDNSADVVPATFGTQIATLVGRVRAARSLCDVLLLSPTANGLTGKVYPTSQYIDQMRAQAVTLNTAMLDFFLHLPVWTDLTSRGLNGSGPHLSTAGGQFGADLLISMLKVQ